MDFLRETKTSDIWLQKMETGIEQEMYTCQSLDKEMEQFQNSVTFQKKNDSMVSFFKVNISKISEV